MPNSRLPIRKVSSLLPKISNDQRDGMIKEAAYFLAEKRGFEGDHQLHDWLEAEKMIHRIFGVNHD